jgi:hypothetical protein
VIFPFNVVFVTTCRLVGRYLSQLVTLQKPWRRAIAMSATSFALFQYFFWMKDRPYLFELYSAVDEMMYRSDAPIASCYRLWTLQRGELHQRYPSIHPKVQRASGMKQ